MQYKAIFIDIDDTILDYVPCCQEAFDAAMYELISQKVGVTGRQFMERKEELFDLFFAIAGRLFSEAKHGQHTIAEVMDLYPAEFIEKSKLVNSNIPDYEQKLVQITEIFKHAFRAAWGKTHTLVPDSKETLEALRSKGYRLFAASNSFGHLQRSRLLHAEVLDYFEKTFISMDIGYDKPDIRFFQHALAEVNLQPSEVLMVGDSMTTDILGAQAAGIDTCFFDRRPEEAKDTSVATFTIHALRELPEII